MNDLKIDAEISTNISNIQEASRKAEKFGFDCIFFNETKHDAFIQAAIAAKSTRSILVGTAVAVAFARSPTLTAYTSWDVQSISRGRFLLGLGSQVKGHIERRFGMKWETPVPKMREYIEVIRHVWRNWQYREKLDYKGDYFSVNLMTDYFSPGAIPYGAVPIYLACVNKRMCSLAGEICEGIHVHPLHTRKYLENVILENVNSGMRKTKKRKIEIAVSCFVAHGSNGERIKQMKEEVRKQIAFYASTRSYRAVLEYHKWGDVCDRLHSLSLQGKWSQMSELISDEMLEEFCVCSNTEEVASRIIEKYRGIASRVRLYSPFDGREYWKKIVASFRK